MSLQTSREPLSDGLAYLLPLLVSPLSPGMGKRGKVEGKREGGTGRGEEGGGKRGEVATVILSRYLAMARICVQINNTTGYEHNLGEFGLQCCHVLPSALLHLCQLGLQLRYLLQGLTVILHTYNRVDNMCSMETRAKERNKNRLEGG